MTVTPEYKAAIFNSWAGEIYGETLFAELARLSSDASNAEAWQLMAELEQVTGERIAPLVIKYGYDVTPPEAEHERGRRSAAEFSNMPHLEFTAMMKPYLTDVVASYQALRDQAPKEDVDAVQFLVDHEAALLRFAELDGGDAGEDSTKAVRDLIAKAARC